MRDVAIRCIALLTAAAGCGPAQLTRPDGHQPAVSPAVGGVSNPRRLVVSVTGVSDAIGDVRVALFAAADGFPDSAHAVQRAARPAWKGAVEFSLQPLPPGTYAAAAYHDRNGDGELNRNSLGWPVEAYGFSNAATPAFGPPRFAAAQVEMDHGLQEIVVHLRNPSD